MKRWRWSRILAAVPLIGLGGCGGQGAAQEQALINQLRASGATVEQTTDPAAWPLSGQEQSLKVNGEVVEVYVYDSPQQADADAAGISPDGQKMVEGTAGNQITVTAAFPLHVYKKDLLIVCYSGSKSGVISLLQAALGPAIAGAG